jgi:hypothetical protein
VSDYVVGHLNEFPAWWYGEPGRPLRVVETPLSPRALADWYAAEEAWNRPLAVQNAVLRVSELSAHDGLTTFYVENQGVWEWAFGSGDDPEVFDRETKAGTGWSVTGATLSEFLVHAAMFEAVLGSTVGASGIALDRACYEKVVAPLKPVSMTPWSWPGPDSRLFIGDHILAFGGVNDRPGTPITDESCYEVFIATRSSDNLAYLDGLGVKWAHNTRLFGEGVYP